MVPIGEMDRIEQITDDKKKNALRKMKLGRAESPIGVDPAGAGGRHPLGSNTEGGDIQGVSKVSIHFKI